MQCQSKLKALRLDADHSSSGQVVKMCSRRSLQVMRISLEGAHKLFIVPFRLVLEEDKKSSYVGARLELPARGAGAWRGLACKLQAMFHLTLNVAVFTFAIFYDLNPAHELHLAERAQFYSLLALECTAMSLAIFMLVNAHQLWTINGAFFRFVTSLNKFHGLDPSHSDGVDHILEAYFVQAVILSGCTIPVAFVMIQLGVHSTYVLSIHPIPLQLLYAAVAGFQVWYLFLIAFHFGAIWLIYANATCLSLRRIAWKPGVSLRQMARCVVLYRSHSIMHNHVMATYRGLIGAGIILISMIQITALWVVIAHHHRAGAFVTAVIGGGVWTLVLVVFMLTMQKAGEVAIQGEGFVTSYVRSRKYLKQGPVMKAFKGCRPIRMQAGFYLNISKMTFPTLMETVVVANVVNLLLL